MASQATRGHTRDNSTLSKIDVLLPPDLNVTPDEWLIDTGSMTLRPDLQVTVLAVVRPRTRECLALSVQGVLTPASLVPILYRGVQKFGKPSAINISDSARAAMPHGLDSLLSSFEIPIQSSGQSLAWE
jgi:hypothetical protein